MKSFMFEGHEIVIDFEHFRREDPAPHMNKGVVVKKAPYWAMRGKRGVVAKAATRCIISVIVDGKSKMAAEGVSYCSEGDGFCKKKGRKLALQAAIMEFVPRGHGGGRRYGFYETMLSANSDMCATMPEFGVTRGKKRVAA